MTSKTPEIKIIGAGAPRTGTVSLMKALELLGFGPCYHMDVVQANDLQWPWVDALDGEQDLKKYKALLEGYGSVCDFPASSAYFELMAAYPDAKVIQSLRLKRARVSVCDTRIILALDRTDRAAAVEDPLVYVYMHVMD